MKRKIIIGVLAGFFLVVVSGWYLMWPDLFSWAKAFGASALLKTWGIYSSITFVCAAIMMGASAVAKHSDVSTLKALRTLKFKHAIAVVYVSVVVPPPLFYYFTMLAFHRY